MARRPGKLDLTIGIAFLVGLLAWAIVVGSSLWWLPALALVLNLGTVMWRQRNR
jgi:hypothetical protein